ncbi:hypothetical protein HDV03_000702 [Kappamyces sp. JEL0829]|nr:hypothetical protein HDV03_000702 [Kappamyces sp. JEL0829]
MSFTGNGVKIANFPVTADQYSGCLDSTPVQPKDTYPQGGAVQVSWKITIPHKSDPGVRVSIQFPGEPMQVLSDHINVNDLAVSVPLPAAKSGGAVLQWSWASQEDGGFYMACSDIMITAKTGAAANATTATGQAATTAASRSSSYSAPTGSAPVSSSALALAAGSLLSLLVHFL